MMVWRKGLKTRILDGMSHGEVIEGLIGVILNAYQLVNGIIEKTADAGPADTVGFGFQV